MGGEKRIHIQVWGRIWVEEPSRWEGGGEYGRTVPGRERGRDGLEGAGGTLTAMGTFQTLPRSNEKAADGCPLEEPISFI